MGMRDVINIRLVEITQVTYKEAGKNKIQHI